MLPRKHNHQMVRIVAMFAAGRRLSSRDVAAECHMAKRNAIHYLNILHADKETHIASYLPYGIPVYAYGPGEDAKWEPKKPVKDPVLDARQKRIARARARLPKYLSIKSVVTMTLGIHHAG
jgi:hypothetical protein